MVGYPYHLAAPVQYPFQLWTVANIDFDKSFEFFSLIELFSESKIVFPEVLPVIAAMLQQGLRDLLRHQDDPDSPAGESALKTPPSSPGAVQTRPRARSMELGKALESRSKSYRLFT